MTPAETYAALLAEEHAAIYLYGVLGPRLPERLRGVARAAYDDHRRHRDYLVDLVRRAGGVPEPGRATYGLPFALTSPAEARRLAVRIEDALAKRWHEAIRGAAADDRTNLALALGDEAEHLASYGSVTAFPGR